MGAGKRGNVKIGLVLNALVMPGLGHLYLGYRWRGISMMLAIVFFIVVPLAKYSMMMTYALNTITVTTPEVVPNMLKAASIAWPGVQRIIYLSLVAIILIWSYGVVDILLMKRKRESSLPLDGGGSGRG